MQTLLANFAANKLWLTLTLLIIMGVAAMQLLRPTHQTEANSFWQSSVSNNTQDIDHSDWQQILDGYLISDHISGVYRFDYARVSADDKQLLDSYLQDLQQLDPRGYSRNTQKAYWINLYNALTVRLILDHYPVDSITTLGESIVSFGPWDDPVAQIQGQALSLNDIEHRILRPLWQDNRIHYAVNCASIGCPNLSAQVFTASNLDSLLDHAARAYVNHPRGVNIENGRLTVSSIYHWYREDFGDTDAALLAHLQQYAHAPLRQQLERYRDGIDHDYDWSLNGL